MNGKELKKLTRYSRKGYIDDPDDIKYIMKKLSGLTLSEAIDAASGNTRECLVLLARVILNEVYELGLDDDEIGEIGFPEFLYLADRMGTPSKTPEWYTGMRTVIDLFEQGAKNNDLFRLFSAIHIGTLFGQPDKEDLSIGDITARERENRNRHWNPWDPLLPYRDQVQKAYEITASLLIGAFEHMCPEKFSMDYILGKYGSWFTKQKIQIERAYSDGAFDECIQGGK